MKTVPKLLVLLKSGISIALLTALFVFLTGSSHGQSLTPVVYSTAGGYYTSSNASLSMTVGEPVIETYTSSSNILTTGFQQPENLSPFLKTLNLVAMLEGYYDHTSGLMSKAQGVADDGQTQFDKWPLNHVDTLSVLLAGSTDPYPYIYQAHGLYINTDGTISLAGVPGALNGSYYIVIRHRQSVETWSANPVSFAATPVSYDFHNSPSQAFGNNEKRLDPESEVYGLYGGEISSMTGEQDGYIDIFDNVNVFNDAQSSAYGYLLTDLTGLAPAGGFGPDGFVDIFDMALVFNNMQVGIGMNTPPNPVKKK
jgi:hypothetical protein